MTAILRIVAVALCAVLTATGTAAAQQTAEGPLAIHHPIVSTHFPRYRYEVARSVFEFAKNAHTPGSASSMIVGARLACSDFVTNMQKLWHIQELPL